jgi:F-type H+-transporting ATPase subunit b
MQIDWWTLALQTVNALILIWILGRYFFRPITEIVTKRQEETKKLFDDAETACKAAANARSEAEKVSAQIQAERERLLADAQKSAHTEAAKLLEQTSQEITKLRNESKAAIARERDAAEQQIIAHASALSIKIARRLLERLPPNVALEAFLAAICAEIGKLSQEARSGFAAAATTGRPIEVVTQAPLNDQETRHVRDLLKEAFGAELPLVFRSDPKLLAGIELHGHNVLLRNSWRTDLDRIREELSREQHPGES